ncbi:hypothetical protein CY34DRAFT_91587, partial [Suillus luteus UH-Slu-Lm8-n1]
VFLADEKERGGLRGFRGNDSSFGQVFIDEIIHSLLFLSVKGINLALTRFKGFFEIDLVVEFPTGWESSVSNITKYVFIHLEGLGYEFFESLLWFRCFLS